jgi:hypothetical protein
MLKISKEERKIQLIYLMAFWIAFSVVFCYVCFFNYPRTDIRSKNLVLEKINAENALLKSQFENAAHLDSLSNMLRLYDPATSQVAQKTNIDIELRSLKNIYEARKDNEDYKIFNQLYLFNRMQLFDKQATWSSKNNALSLKKNREDCEIGFKEKKASLNLKNAIAPRQ